MFNKLEEVYEECEFHSLEYTKHKYQTTFKANFDKDYTQLKKLKFK